MRENLPQGSFLIQEVYTPRVGPADHFRSRRPRFVTRLTREEMRDPLYDFVFVADAAYNRFLRPRNKRHQADFLALTAERYREIFDTFELVREFVPGRLRDGPTLRLYKTDPQPPAYATERRSTSTRNSGACSRPTSPPAATGSSSTPRSTPAAGGSGWSTATIRRSTPGSSTAPAPRSTCRAPTSTSSTSICRPAASGG